MGKLEAMKERYDQIMIPEELNIRIQQEIEKSRRRQEQKGRAGSRHRLRRTVRSMEAMGNIRRCALCG